MVRADRHTTCLCKFRSFSAENNYLIYQVQAGLFSAVAAAFLVEFYKDLTPDPKDISNHYLAYISSQIQNIPSAINNISSTPQLLTPPDPFHLEVNPTNVLINSLWFSSLVFALIASSISTLVKQWIQSYADISRSSPRGQTRIRQYRYAGLKRWQVPAMVDVPPLLMCIALTLFLAGVVSFLWSLESAVLWTATVPILLWFIIYAASIVLPSFYPDCPYRSPEAAIFYLFVVMMKRTWQVLRTVPLRREGVTRPTRSKRLRKKSVQTPLARSWHEQEHQVKKNASLDVDILVTADEIFADGCLGGSIRGAFAIYRGSSLCKRFTIFFHNVWASSGKTSTGLFPATSGSLGLLV